MPDGPELITGRLHLRRWRASDLEPFAAMNADPVVMEHFPSTLTRAETSAFIERAEAAFEERGFGWWAVDSRDEGEFLGFVGLSWIDPPFPFAPAVETGWRLSRSAWGHGYATEAAQAAVAFGFSQLDLDQIVAFTVPANRRSQAVMGRLGMVRDPVDDFENPRLNEGHPLRPHVLYRLERQRWQEGAGGRPTTS